MQAFGRKQTHCNLGCRRFGRKRTLLETDVQILCLTCAAFQIASVPQPPACGEQALAICRRRAGYWRQPPKWEGLGNPQPPECRVGVIWILSVLCLGVMWTRVQLFPTHSMKRNNAPNMSGLWRLEDAFRMPSSIQLLGFDSISSSVRVQIARIHVIDEFLFKFVSNITDEWER